MSQFRPSFNNERRRVPRRDIQAKIGVLLGGQYQIQNALQLGEGGMLLQATQELRLNCKILITFKVPLGQYVIARAEVRYLQDDGIHRYGVEFVDLDFSVKRQIRNFVAGQGL